VPLIPHWPIQPIPLCSDTILRHPDAELLAAERDGAGNHWT